MILISGSNIPLCQFPALAHSRESGQPSETVSIPSIHDPALRSELVFDGLEKPTSITFLGPNDLLVLEKEKGTVQRIINGTILPKPLLDVNVATLQERGMLGIAASKNNMTGLTYVFLFYTETESEDMEDVITQKPPLGNRLYRFELSDNELLKPKLLLDLPAEPGVRRIVSNSGAHNGGAIKIGPDNNIYISIGDLSRSTRAQNIQGIIDGTGGILRIGQDGDIPEAVLGNNTNATNYFAYGIRNSFGFDFDPLNGNLWDTENGPGSNDEVNLVEPGFNSGWLKVQGMASNNIRTELMNLDAQGIYSDPEFVWSHTVAPTGITFLTSNKLGTEYENDMFVASFNNGQIYHFELAEDRSKLFLDGPLKDKISNNLSEIEEVIFGEGFEQISDLEVNPYDGYPYVVAYGPGKIYRIVPAEEPRYVNNNETLRVLEFNDSSYFSTGNHTEIVLGSPSYITLHAEKRTLGLISNPLYENLTSIETNIRIVTQSKPDNHAGIVWGMGNSTYYVFLRPHMLVVHNTMDNEFKIHPLTRNIGEWYSLGVRFLENNFNIYLNGNLQFQLPTKEIDGTITHIGIRAEGNIAHFDPIVIGSK